MGIRRVLNPVIEALLDKRRSGLFTAKELAAELRTLDISLEDLKNTTIEIRTADNTRPVTTLVTIEDEQMSLDAPGGPIITTKQRRAIENLESQATSRETKA